MRTLAPHPPLGLLDPLDLVVRGISKSAGSGSEYAMKLWKNELVVGELRGGRLIEP